MIYTKEEAQELLPRVGDEIMLAPSIDRTDGLTNKYNTPERCKVVEVNRAHLWYRVVFANGLTECRKVPDSDEKGAGSK